MRRSLGCWGVLILSFLSPTSSIGQPLSPELAQALGLDPVRAASPVGLRALAGQVDPATYRVGPGDQFELNLSGRMTRVVPIVVGAEGTVFIPDAGVVRVSGLTLAEARRQMLEAVSAHFPNVRADVRLSQVRTFKVYLSGQVRFRGAVEVPAASRMSDVVQDSLLVSGASLRNIEVRRAASPAAAPEIGDVERFRRTGSRLRDPFLWDGDVVTVPLATRAISIEGPVARPGSYELATDDSITTLLALSGGLLPSADLHAQLRRFDGEGASRLIEVDLSEVLAGRSDERLKDGDRIFVRNIPRFHESQRASIYGEVAHPGPYPIEPGTTRFSVLLQSAGGFLDRADRSAVHIFRASRSTPEGDAEFDRLARLSREEMTSSEYEVFRARLSSRREDFRIDWDRLRENAALDFILQDGDIVRVDARSATIRVEGEVKRPGLVRFDPASSIEDYIRIAGGFSARAAKGQLRVTRSVTGQTLRSRDVQSIEPGDQIWVPERGDSTVWHDFQQLILVAAQVATVIIAVRR